MNLKFKLLFFISLGFGANYFQEAPNHVILKNQSNSDAFNIPTTLRLIGIMVEFQIEDPNNPKTSGMGIFLDQNATEYNHFYDSTIPRCDGFLLDPPPHNAAYFQRQLEAAGSYYENISAGELPFESYMILNSSSPIFVAFARTTVVLAKTLDTKIVENANKNNFLMVILLVLILNL